ncbi:histidine ammonia-lyase, partial [Virgibacillus halodenitrificans]|nr:histidine ammonia-lyase [Virgibacillus halodenitrificans]
MEQKVIELDGYTLNRHQIEKVAYGEYQAEVPEQALERVRKSRKRIETQLDEG